MKTAIVTGGTKGIGRAIGLRLAAKGYDVAVSYRRDDAGAKAFADEVKKLGRTCVLVQADHTEDGSMDRVFDEAKKTFPHLDVFVSNAAATAFLPLMALKAHQIDKTMSVTIKSYILGSQRAAAMMEGRGGNILAISGMDTIHTLPFHALLGACKSALETLTRQLASELAYRKIRVNAVNPGFVDTDSTRFYAKDEFDRLVKGIEAMNPIPRVGTPEDVANVVEFLLSDLASYITGQTLHVDGGLQIAPLFPMAMVAAAPKG